MSLPYGSTSRNPHGDTTMRGRREGLPYAAGPDYTTRESPGNYAERQSYLKTNPSMRFAMNSRGVRVVTWRQNLTETPYR